MERYQKASHEMRDEIIDIISICFQEPLSVIKFFFDEKRFEIDNFYVCILENKIVSVLYALDSKLRINNKICSGIYIYAACTLKGYRKHGFMSKLLKYVNKVYTSKGYYCSFLSPASLSLSKFYERLGYRNFFKIRKIEFSKDELIKLCKINENSEYSFETSLDLNEIVQMRREVYKNEPVVIYNEKDIEFASKLYSTFSGGKLVSTHSGYAICMLSEDEVKLLDLTYKNSLDAIELIKKIYFEFPGKKKYIIETSTANAFFENLGDVCFNGMILPLTKSCNEFIKKETMVLNKKSNPYLGISLE